MRAQRAPASPSSPLLSLKNSRQEPRGTRLGARERASCIHRRPMTEIVAVSRIRDLNDQLRRSLTGGMLVMTRGIIALGAKRQLAILSAIAAFDAFSPENDPYGEHDFGALTIEGERIFFKID